MEPYYARFKDRRLIPLICQLRPLFNWRIGGDAALHWRIKDLPCYLTRKFLDSSDSLPHCLQGIGAEFVGEPMVSSTTADNVSLPGIIRKENDSLTNRTTDFFQRGADKMTVLFP
ncbi:MAG: hypothetical protein HYT78_12470, partial [Deltaproteobacteria bacterium]|nr:hypothetical protein [Deltaproteobacteria bacterium]